MPAEADWWSGTINFELVRGNAIWRFGAILVILLVTLAAGRIIQFILYGFAARREKKTGPTALVLFIRALPKPAAQLDRGQLRSILDCLALP